MPRNIYYLVKPSRVCSDGYVVGCSDGLWDVLSPRRALQLAAEVKLLPETYCCSLYWNAMLICCLSGDVNAHDTGLFFSGS